jgi:hypothetical protein
MVIADIGTTPAVDSPRNVNSSMKNHRTVNSSKTAEMSVIADFFTSKLKNPRVFSSESRTFPHSKTCQPTKDNKERKEKIKKQK